MNPGIVPVEQTQCHLNRDCRIFVVVPWEYHDFNHVILGEKRINKLQNQLKAILVGLRPASIDV